MAKLYGQDYGVLFFTDSVYIHYLQLGPTLLFCVVPVVPGLKAYNNDVSTTGMLLLLAIFRDRLAIFLENKLSLSHWLIMVTLQRGVQYYNPEVSGGPDKLEKHVM